MEKKLTIFDHIAHILCIYAVTILSMVVITLLCGEEARESSTIFRLGGEGIPIETMLQFLGVTIGLGVLRHLVFSELVFKKLAIMVRLVLMFLAVVILVGVAAHVFGWFPVGQWQAWVSFIVMFFIYFAGTLGILTLKRNLENRKLDEALYKYRNKKGDTASDE